jgi:hypothetical protein
LDYPQANDERKLTILRQICAICKEFLIPSQEFVIRLPIPSDPPINLPEVADNL